MHQRRWLAVGLLAVALMMAVTMAFAQDAAAQRRGVQFVRIATGFPGGTWTPQAVLWAALISAQVDGVEAVSMPGGTDDNLRLVQNKDAAAGFSYPVNAADAYNGVGNFNTPHRDLRHMMSLHSSSIYLVSRIGSNILEADDLRTAPARVAVGGRGFMAERYLLALFDALGMDVDALRRNGGSLSYMPFADAVRLMQDGQLDVWIAIGGVPYAEVLQLEQSPGIHFVKVSDELLDGIMERLPGLYRETIAANAHPTLNEDYPTLGTRTIVFAHADTDEELVYQMVRTYWANLEQIYQLGTWAHDIKLETALQGTVLPLHPGAERYYREVGLIP